MNVVSALNQVGFTTYNHCRIVHVDVVLLPFLYDRLCLNRIERQLHQILELLAAARHFLIISGEVGSVALDFQGVDLAQRGSNNHMLAYIRQLRTCRGA